MKAGGDSCPSSFYRGKEFVGLTGWEAGMNLFRLDMVLDGKIPVPPNHAFHNHCFLIELSWLMLVVKHH